MSWGIQYENKEKFEREEGMYPMAAVTAEMEEQIVIAREVASKLIASGAVGGPEKDYYISISGHANPGHEPAPAWANDCITVMVNQKTPPAAAPVEAPAELAPSSVA